MAAIGGRDTSIFLFRALGKILFCKSKPYITIHFPIDQEDSMAAITILLYCLPIGQEGSMRLKVEEIPLSSCSEHSTKYSTAKVSHILLYCLHIGQEDSMAAIGGRDTSIFLFRALGKILYCKG